MKKEENANMIKAAMFVPHTYGSALAKKLREIENSMGGMTGNKLKVVEKAGMKLADILTSSNPWKGQPCSRLDCLLCITKLNTGKHQKQECSKRNLVYETNCVTCKAREKEKIEAEIEGMEERERKIN